MLRTVKRPSFITGVSIGVLLAIILKLNQQVTKPTPRPIERPFQVRGYHKWFEKTKLIRRLTSFDSLRYDNRTYFLESKYLHNKVTVLCLVLVKTQKNAKAIEDTWGKHCNQLQFINLNTEKRKIPIRRNKEESSWVLLCNMLNKVPEEFGWVFVIYDYTFVIMDNLRLFLAGLNHNDRYYLGHAVKFWNTIYNMGQAGYVLSKGSLNVFKKKFHSLDACMKIMTYRNQEDYYLGQNLGSFNITPQDTRDHEGLSTFHPYNLYQVFFPGDNHYKFSVFPHKCCSSISIAFQSIEGDKMYTYYYLLYRLQLFHSGQFGNKPPIKTFQDDDVWKNFLKARDISENITSEQYFKIWENIIDDPTSFARNMKREEYFDYV